ncbi:MAG: alpha-glucosidase, partial [Acidobacteria bacterium]
FLAPFFRNHHAIDGYDQEPWRFGKYYEGIIRKYLKLRYQLLPFLYTTLEEAHRTGVPLFRPLMLNYQDDSSTYNLDDQFMVGDDLLVAPIVKPDLTSRLVYLPKGIWYDFWTNKKYDGGTMIRVDVPLETVPMFVRGGAVIPMGPEMKYVGERAFDPITFAIYPNEEGFASATLYEDDGNSLAYQRRGFRRTKLEVRRVAQAYVVKTGAPEGDYKPGAQKFVFLIKPTATAKTVSVSDEGTPRTIEIRY